MKINKQNSGFTLIEVIMVIILVSIIAGVSGNLILSGAESYKLQYNRRDLMYQGKLAMSRMDKDIRMIRSATAGDIITFTATDLKFIDINGQTVEFKLTGSNLIRNTNTLATNIGSLTFSYLRQDGTAAAAAEDIWSIQISLTVSGSEDISFRTRIFLRDIHGLYTSWKEI